MAVTVSDFRAAFPAFANTTRYATPMVTLWLNYVNKTLDAGRWGDLLDMGTMLALAHFLTVEMKAASTAQNGGSPGGVGLLTSKSADGVSASYDVSSVTEEGAGFWNATSYGTRYYRMARMVGAGPIQLGYDASVSASGGAWPGALY